MKENVSGRFFLNTLYNHNHQQSRCTVVFGKSLNMLSNSIPLTSMHHWSILIFLTKSNKLSLNEATNMAQNHPLDVYVWCCILTSGACQKCQLLKHPAFSTNHLADTNNEVNKQTKTKAL